MTAASIDPPAPAMEPSQRELVAPRLFAPARVLPVALAFVALAVFPMFGDDYYKLPTVAELRQQFARWRKTRMEGYLVFSWRYPDDRPDLWLANHPELHAQLALENAR